MFKNSVLAVLGAAVLGLCIVGCGETGDGMDYEQNTDVPEAATLVVSIVGADFGSWDPAKSAADTNCLFKKVDSSHYQLVVAEVKVGSEFKFVQDGGWSTQYGVEDMDWNKSTAGIITGTKADYNEGTSNRSNFKLIKGGKMTVDYYPYYFANADLNNPFVVTIA